MLDSKSYDEALDALYKAATVSANFIETALTSKDMVAPADKERLEVALKVLKITWADEEDEE